MRHAVRSALAAALVVVSILPASAEEPYLDFVRGLREKQLYDMAQFYLEQIEVDPNLPQEVKELLAYEKAITLMEGAKLIRNTETQTKQYDQAEAFLEQFTKQFPNHPKAGQANTDRAQIFLGKARVEVYQAKSPANSGNKAPFQTKAREYVAKARAIFKAAHDQHEAAWKKFPTYINKDQDEEQFDARRVAEVNYIRAQLDLALCTYEESQTYDETAADYKKLLTKASTEFDTIHQKYRSQVGGLYARMWQGKCFEEQEDIGKALGIYNELLGHPGNSETMNRLQDQVTQFRLICLNHDQRKDYQLVIQEASEWLTKAKTKARSTIGLGIRWERATAYEAMSLKRDLNKSDHERVVRQALEDAREINKYPGQYKDLTTFMIQRLNAALGKDKGDPKDFDGALGLGRNMVKQIKQLEDEITAARRANKPADEVKKLTDGLEAHLRETARILKLALELSNDDTEIAQVNNARYLLSFVYWRNKQSFEAGILGEFVGSRYAEQDPQMALESAYIALVSWHQAHEAAKARKEDRTTEINQMIRVANLIAKNWPESDQANDSRMTLGELHSALKKPAEAAAWYGQVPEASSKYTAAQIAAGQAYWTAYLEAALKPEGERAPTEELEKWQAAAEKHLTIGIDKTSATIAKEAIPPDEMVAAKVTLAQIKIARGLYPDSLKLLVGDPHPVVAAIAVKEGEPRPAKGVKAKDFFILTYQLILRSYVGTQEIDKALEAMGKLESLAGGPQSEAVMQIYVDLGKELQKEIARVQNDPQRLAEVKASFDKFLGELYKRRDTMTYNSLIWIAQTYYNIGEGLSDKSAAAEYYKKSSSAYSDIIAKAEAGAKDEDKEFAQSKRLVAVKMELSKSKRREGDYTGSIDLIATVLKAAPRTLDAQFEAALALQDWGMSGQAESQKMLLAAIEGPKDGPLKDLAWGWGKTGLQLQRVIDSGKGTPAQKELYYEARFNSFAARQQLGKLQSSTPKKEEELDKALAEIDAFTAISGEMPDNWFDKFSKLYEDVQKERSPGTPPKPLARPTAVVARDPSTIPIESEDDPKENDKKAAAAPVAAKPQGMGTVTIVLILLVMLAATGGIAFVMMKPKKRRRLMTNPDESAALVVPAGAAAAAASATPSGKVARPRPAAAATGAAPVASGTTTATARKPEGAAAPRPAAKPAAAKPAAKPANPKPPA